MKTEKYLLVGAILALLCSSCGNTSQKEAKNIQETMAFVTTDTTVKDSLQLIWIRDNARERIMPLSLFGELPLPLIDSTRQSFDSRISCRWPIPYRHRLHLSDPFSR